ncbi:hypothetical protein [Ferruginibacter albus]|uniref:hypothetical protein n=1 Tax=Ferruginibacter albus TaxID=2875540 RepID=UPI001CC6FBF7|nr:hypothetical protein [Ferruginibacter albus]UAY52640.1 hypothetical protein K9M53_02855 [Ferruginibacter albus]
MKKILITLFVATALLSLASCKKEDTGGSPGGGGDTGTGMFWSNQYGSPIQVSVDGYSGSVTSYYNQTDAPDCGSSGCFSITLSKGSHSFTASDGDHTWSGSINISSSCNTMLLHW